MAQPAWKTNMQQQQQPSTMPIVVEGQHSHDESDSSVAPSFWSPPDGYHSSTSTQRNADAARDAQQDHDSTLLDEADWDDYWGIHTENFS